MMCEFCKNSTKWDSDKYYLVPDRNLSDGIMQAENKIYQIGTFDSRSDFFDTLEINFCPVCGRKLVEE